MKKPQDPEAAETVQTTSVPAVDLPRLVRLLDKWRDDAAWLERLHGRLEPYNAYTADAIRACCAELEEIILPNSQLTDS